VKRGARGGNTGRRARWLVRLAIVAATLPARPAKADPTTPARRVHLDATRCEATSLDEVASVLRVEIFNRLVEGPSPEDAYRVTLGCAGDRVFVSVTVPGGATRSLRTDLGTTPPNVRARVVALAVAELVRDLDRERAPSPPPPHAPPDARQEQVAPVSRPPAESAAIDLGAFAQASTFRLDGTWLAGGGLRFDYTTGRLSAGLDVALQTMTERFEPGTAQALLAYGSPTLAWRERWGRMQARLGGGYALGAARLSGHAADATAFGATTTGPWTSPYAFAALRVTVTEGVSVDARGQLGWVTSPVVGEVTAGGDVALEGLWASVQVGLAIAL
jgi:hypothetical protein